MNTQRCERALSNGCSGEWIQLCQPTAVQLCMHAAVCAHSEQAAVYVCIMRRYHCVSSHTEAMGGLTERMAQCEGGQPRGLLVVMGAAQQLFPAGRREEIQGVRGGAWSLLLGLQLLGR